MSDDGIVFDRIRAEDFRFRATDFESLFCDSQNTNLGEFCGQLVADIANYRLRVMFGMCNQTMQESRLYYLVPVPPSRTGK